MTVFYQYTQNKLISNDVKLAASQFTIISVMLSDS